MGSRVKSIRLSRHAAGYVRKRGFSVEEVKKAIQTCPWEPAELNRMQCQMDVPFNAEWNGKLYKTKKVRPVFVEEKDDILVVTVYTYFF